MPCAVRPCSAHLSRTSSSVAPRASKFRPEISAVDLISLPNYQIYLKLRIDGKVSRPFSAEPMYRSN